MSITWLSLHQVTWFNKNKTNALNLSQIDCIVFYFIIIFLNTKIIQY